MSEQQTFGVMEHSLTPDGKAIIVDCGFCGGCGEGDASGYACSACDGRGFDVYPLPKRDYEAAGMRAFKAGKLLSDCPYRFGWPMLGWCRGYEYAEEEQGAMTVNYRSNSNADVSVEGLI